MSRFETYESIYWVFTQSCNDRCAHCYNDSSPEGQKMSLDDCLAVVGNLPESLGRLVLSGGEPLAERSKLYRILEAVRDKYRGATQVMLQTNGDLLDGTILDEILGRGVTRIDVASIDRYHKHAGARKELLTALFLSRGMSGDETQPLIERETYLKKNAVSFGFWGANEDFWLGGSWARGQALKNDVWLKDGGHNFCAILSGARGFLGGTDLPQELSIQLWKVNPCCAGTKDPMGDARVERVSAILDRVAGLPVFQRLNEGNPYAMGESVGVREAEGRRRADELQSVCLWCDDFFTRHYDMAKQAPRDGQAPIPLPARRRTDDSPA